jgi:hypothetical protein
MPWLLLAWSRSRPVSSVPRPLAAMLHASLEDGSAAGAIVLKP